MKRLMVTGHVGKDPVVRFSGGGERFISFSIAADLYKNEETQWVEVSCSEKKEKLFNLIENHVKKGVRLWVSGQNKVSLYINRTTGKPNVTELLYLNDLEFQSAKKDDSNISAEDTTENQEIPPETPDELVTSNINDVNDIPY